MLSDTHWFTSAPPEQGLSESDEIGRMDLFTQAEKTDER
jgi:hypothetical protein